MKKVIALIVLVFGFLYANDTRVKTLTLDEAQQPKTAVAEVLKIFKNQVSSPVSKMTVKIPYNINYSIVIGKKKYYVIEYEIKIIFKNVRENAFAVNEKKYIIRFIIDSGTDLLSKEEVYSLTKETE